MKIIKVNSVTGLLLVKWYDNKMVCSSITEASNHWLRAWVGNQQTKKSKFSFSDISIRPWIFHVQPDLYTSGWQTRCGDHGHHWNQVLNSILDLSILNFKFSFKATILFFNFWGKSVVLTSYACNGIADEQDLCMPSLFSVRLWIRISIFDLDISLVPLLLFPNKETGSRVWVKSLLELVLVYL